jgi:hypothetical protein
MFYQFISSCSLCISMAAILLKKSMAAIEALTVAAFIKNVMTLHLFQKFSCPFCSPNKFSVHINISDNYTDQVVGS